MTDRLCRTAFRRHDDAVRDYCEEADDVEPSVAILRALARDEEPPRWALRTLAEQCDDA